MNVIERLLKVITEIRDACEAPADVFGADLAEDIREAIAVAEAEIEENSSANATLIQAIDRQREEIDRLRLALGMNAGDKLVSGENGSYLIETAGGNRRRLCITADEYAELERLRVDLGRISKESESFLKEVGELRHFVSKCRLIADVPHCPDPGEAALRQELENLDEKFAKTSKH